MNNECKHVLVVDDEPLIYEMLKLSLSLKGHQVVTVDNGLEALQRLTEDDFDIVFLDVRMPVLDGLSVIKIIRECEQRPHQGIFEDLDIVHDLHHKLKGGRVPVVAVTGNLGDRELLLEAGMDDYISKPYSLEKIYAAVDKFGNKRQQKSIADRRVHPRYVIREDIVNVHGATSGQVIDISLGGLSFSCVGGKNVPNESIAYLTCEKNKMKTASFPVKIVRQEKTDCPSEVGCDTKRLGVMFNYTDQEQQGQIKKFISNLV